MGGYNPCQNHLTGVVFFSMQRPYKSKYDLNKAIDVPNLKIRL